MRCHPTVERDSAGVIILGAAPCARPAEVAVRLEFAQEAVQLAVHAVCLDAGARIDVLGVLVFGR
jgi:hypothetical protein